MGGGVWEQVWSSGRVELVSGVGPIMGPIRASAVELSGGRGLGPEDMRGLAGLLREAPLLASLDLR